MIVRLPIWWRGGCRRCGFNRTHTCKAAPGRLALRIERKHLLQGMALLGARFGDSGKHQPNLGEIGLLGSKGTQERT